MRVSAYPSASATMAPYQRRAPSLQRSDALTFQLPPSPESGRRGSCIIVPMTTSIGVPRLEPRQIALFERDGFVVIPGFFSGAEIAPLREACIADPTIGGRLRAVADSSGKAQDIIEWTTFSDDYLGMLPRLARLIDGSEALLGKPVYH